MAEAASVPNLRELCRNACVGCRSKKVRCLQGAVEGTCERSDLMLLFYLAAY